MKNRYKILGLGLCGIGVIVAFFSYFTLGSVPLAAVGISAILIGITCFVLAYNHPSLSPEVYQLMLRTGIENTEALLEELRLSDKAVYLPSIMGYGHQRTLIPLVSGADINLTKEEILDRFLVQYGSDPDDRAFSIVTPGSINIDKLETIPGPNANEIESAINYILSELLNIVDSASVILVDERVYVTVSNPKLVFDDIQYYQCVGSLIASIIAAISSEALGRPIRIIEENGEKGLSTITLEVLP